MGDVHKELHRVLAPHLALMRKDLSRNWPDLDPEVTLINWLCERNNLKPPQASLRRCEKKEAARQAPKGDPSKLPPLSGKGASEALAIADAPPQAGGALQPVPPDGPAPLTARPGATSTAAAASALVAAAARAPEAALLRSDEERISRDDKDIGLRSLNHVSSKVVADAASYMEKMDLIRSGNDRVTRVIANLRQDIRGKFIAKVPLLSDDVLTPEEQFRLVGKLRPWNFQAGQTIVREGDVGDELFIVERGICLVTRNDTPGVTEMGREDFFGELAVIYAHPRPRGATVTAKTNVTALSLSKGDLVEVIGEQKTELLKVVARSRFFAPIPLLGKLSATQKLKVTRKLHIETWHEGATLQVQNAHVSEEQRRMYIIEEGTCREDVVTATRTGTATSSTKLVTGQYFGMLSMFYGSPTLSTITAETPVTTLSLSHADLDEIFHAGDEGATILDIVHAAMSAHLVRQALGEVEDLRDEAIENILAHTEEVKYKRWQPLFQKGATLDKVYVLVEGQLTEHDGEVDTLRDAHMQGEGERGCWERLTPGGAFGLEHLWEKTPTAHSTVAASSDCTVLCIPGIILRGVLNPEARKDGASKTGVPARLRVHTPI